MRGFLLTKTVQSSPCTRKTRQKGPSRASRASFIPEVGLCDSCWASFIPQWPGAPGCGAGLRRGRRRARETTRGELRSACRLVVQPGPAAHGRRSQALRSLRRLPRRRGPNVARNSPAATSHHEIASLQLQRLWAVSTSGRGKLCATYVWIWPCRRPGAMRVASSLPHSRQCLLR